jgi:periplasmic protein TonB
MFRRIFLPCLACLLLLTPAIALQIVDEPKGSAQEPIFDLGPGISPPQPISTPAPTEWPPSLGKGKHRRQGTCVLAFVVDESGNVRDLRVTNSTDKRMDQSVMETVKLWKFKPATKDGHVVAVRTSTEVDFRLF